LKAAYESFIFTEKGRSSDEQAFVYMENGKYCGYGFVSEDNTIASFTDLDPFLIRQKNTLETQRIVQSYLLKHPKKKLLPCNEVFL
jgi:DNA polymerase-3 subunit epsilon